MNFLEEELVKIDVEVETAEDAIKESGNLLLENSLVESSYVEAMIDSYRKNGAYFVLAPKIAIPHARPEDGVIEASVSLVRLKHPIEFGSKLNDPVQLVFGLGAASSDDHLKLLRKLTTLLNRPDNVEVLLHAKSYQEIQKIL